MQVTHHDTTSLSPALRQTTFCIHTPATTNRHRLGEPMTIEPDINFPGFPPTNAAVQCGDEGNSVLCASGAQALMCSRV